VDGSDALPDENATESPNGAQPACAGIQSEAADPDARSAVPDRGDPGIDPIALVCTPYRPRWSQFSHGLGQKQPVRTEESAALGRRFLCFSPCLAASASPARLPRLKFLGDERPQLALRTRLAAGSQHVNVFRVRRTVVAVYHNLSP